MLPLLVVALLVWAGIIVFLFSVDRKVAGLERKLDELRTRTGAANSVAEELRR